MRFTLLGAVCCLLNSCQDVQEKAAQKTAAPLVAGLNTRLEKLSGISIENRSSKLLLKPSEDGWYLDHPYNVPVHGAFMNSALGSLLSTPLGQKVPVAESEIPELGLLDPSAPDAGDETIKISLLFNDGSPKTEFILGHFDTLENDKDTAIYGEEVTARRYVRFLGDNSVHLTPSSLSYLDPTPDKWEARSYPPIKRLSTISVKMKDGETWQASKTSSYSVVQVSTSNGVVPSKALLASLFDVFLSIGQHEGVMLENSSTLPSAQADPAYLISATDRFGGNYELTVFRELDKPTERSATDNLAPGMLSVEGEKATAYFLCELKVSLEFPTAAQAQMIAALEGRFIRLSNRDISKIEEISEEIRNGHEEN